MRSRAEFFKPIFCAALFVLTLSSTASAGTLVIVGNADLSVQTVDDLTVRLTGNYGIENRGDESAKEVAPQFEIGSWSYAGEPRLIEAGKTVIWKVDQAVKLDKLRCRTGDRCAGLELPLQGAFPLLVTRHYQDMNGYKFSAAEELPVLVGNIDPDVQAELRQPRVDGKMEISGDGSEFEVRGLIQNFSNEAKTVALSLFTSRNLQIVSRPEVVEVPGGGAAKFDAALQNFSGLPGSSYAVYAVLQWQEGANRNATAFSQVASVKEPSRASRSAAIIASVLLVSLFALYFFVLRSPKKG